MQIIHECKFHVMANKRLLIENSDLSGYLSGFFSFLFAKSVVCSFIAFPSTFKKKLGDNRTL